MWYHQPLVSFLYTSLERESTLKGEWGRETLGERETERECEREKEKKRGRDNKREGDSECKLQGGNGRE